MNINIEKNRLSQTFFQMAPFKETKKAMAPPTRLLKKLPLKTHKTFFFALHQQLHNIKCLFQIMNL